ncbi:MAG TPA: trimeric intracellular cation channel family protein [Tepidisphaeraceae bacterium]|nr:trimeric intracellular cation channel family protein [Tepidisphaeraceae bacterium]
MHSAFLHYLTVALDWVGTLVFALSGALLGVQKRFDLFGVLFLSFVVAVVGGMIRDVLIGAVPPVAITDIHYFAIAMIGGVLTFYCYPNVTSHQRQILLLDAVGLALFAVTGAQKALDHGINPLMAAILGMLTGIGGGMTRDLLAGNIPFVLRADLYAVAALAGGAIVSIGAVRGVQPQYPMILGAAVCIFLRLMAIYHGWRAPAARWSDDKAA